MSEKTYQHNIIKFTFSSTPQISDSMQLAVILAISGGLMDAYTYLFRDNVFANAQTGNIILFGVHLSNLDIPNALKYLFPILAFCAGIALAELIRHRFLNSSRLHWRQISALAEIVILFYVGLLPTEHNNVANAFVSLACGIQVESFRKVNGYAAATTMCIGNLRSGVQSLCDFLLNKKAGSLKKGFTYLGLILSFSIGAVLGKEALRLFGQKAIWCSSIFLLLAFFIMFVHKKEKEES